MTAYVPSTLERVARLADGWRPAGVPPANVGPTMDGVREMARAAAEMPAGVQTLT